MSQSSNLRLCILYQTSLWLPKMPTSSSLSFNDWVRNFSLLNKSCQGGFCSFSTCLYHFYLVSYVRFEHPQGWDGFTGFCIAGLVPNFQSVVEAMVRFLSLQFGELFPARFTSASGSWLHSSMQNGIWGLFCLVSLICQG